MQKTCKQCSAGFEISNEDLAFYDKISPIFNNKKCAIPSPTFCPNCRYQRRLAQRNERNFHKRTCDATGKEIVSIFSPDKKVPVYNQKYWWSDKWNAKDYGREFDFNRPFFKQFKELFHQVPQLAINNSQSENSEYTNQSELNKNCYFIVSSDSAEDCYYGMWYQSCKDCMDCLYLQKSELCYEVFYGKSCYTCTFSQNLENCSDCHYSQNCIGCKFCFGCINLRNKEYYIFNKPYIREEYFKKVKETRINQRKLKEFFLQSPQKYYTGKQNENFLGDYVQEVKNSWDIFNCRNAENINHCQDAWNARNCYDMTETFGQDFCLEIEGSAYTASTFFCMKIKNTHESFYSCYCYFSHDLFGCVGLKNSAYCILNKQYSKEDYQVMIAKIIGHMQKTTEWGEHFPKENSFFAYNETTAQEYFPLTKEQALLQGYKWKDPDSRNNLPQTVQVPEKIQDTPDSIQKEFLACKECGKNYKIIPQELVFYRKMDIAIPTICPDCRHKARMNLRNPRKLWLRICARCGREIQTSYAPERPEIVYCEECYLKEVY